MAEQTSDSTYRISGLYVTPNWNGNSDRVAMLCGIGATIKVLRKVDVVISADPGATLPKTWNMTARNTILRTTNKVYLYARVERNGANGMYIWSENFYDVTGVAGDKVAVNNEQYYYIRVGELGTDRVTLNLDYGKYGVNEDGTETETPEYNWNDFWKWDSVNKVIVFLQAIGALVMKSIVLAGQELNQVLTSDEKDSVDESSDNAVVTAGFLQKWVKKIQGMFIRKDIADGTDHPLHAGEIIAKRSNAEGSNGIVRTERFSSTSGAMDGYGAGMWMLEDGTGIMETDLFYVRRAAYFRSLTIAEVKHMGGEVILSAAACQIAYVVPLGGTPMNPKPVEELATPKFYRCFFEKQANGRKVYNEWMKDDQSRCQRFDADGNEVEGSFYWRLVVGVGEDEDFYYVDLSFADCATGSNAPKSNDNIVLFGHRNPTASTYDRTCAQVYSTVGIHAPSRAYYSGITSYDLSQAQRPEYLERDAQGNVEWYVGGFDDNSGKEHYIKYNTRTGLDIRTSSMTVIADGKDVSVGEALGENWKFVTTDDKAPTTSGKVDEWIPADGINPSREEWTDAEYQDHVGEYLITSDGFTYEFVYDTNKGYGWQISSDEYLLNAQKDASSALKNLSDMADDGVITSQEKLVLRSELERLTNDVNAVNNDAVSANISSSAVIRNMNEWFLVFRTITEVGILANMNDTTSLSNLTVYLSTSNSIPTVSTLVRPDTTVSSSPVGRRHDFRQCYSNVYMWLSNARSEVNGNIMNTVNDILAGDIDINQEVMNAVKNIGDEVKGQNMTISSLQGNVANLANNVVYTDPESGKTWNLLKGMIATDNFSTLFASAIDENGNIVTQADITAFVKKGKDGKLESGVSISADKIDFEAADITIFSQNFRISSKELSIYYDEAGKKEIITIDTDNFKLDKDGNAYFFGEVHATSGSFDGRVSAIGGFDMSYDVLDVASHAVNAQITAECSVAIVKFSQTNNTVILPREPRPGQVLKILPFGNSLSAKDLRVTIPGGSYILITRTDCRKDNGIPLVGSGRVGEFIFIPNIDSNGNGGWYYISEV